MSIQTYIVDNYHLQAASALAAASAFRSLAGFGFPLFAGEQIGFYSKICAMNRRVSQMPCLVSLGSVSFKVQGPER